MKCQRRLWVAAAFATASVVSGAAVASASSGADSTVPPDGSMAGHDVAATTEPVPGTLADDGSGEPTSPEAQAFCEAELATEAAFNSEDEAMIATAVEALTAAAEPVDMTDSVAALLAADPESEEFAEPYAEVIDYMKVECGYAQIEAVASEYHFDGVPTEWPAGPVIIGLENAGEQVHEMILMRINDDVTLSAEELLALPDEESNTMVTPAAFVFAFPGTVSSATADLTPGRYLALCFLPEGATPDVLAQLETLGVDGPEDTIPADAGLELGPPHFTKGMLVEITVA